MTKVCKKLFLFICFAVICLTVFCSCNPLRKIEKLSNIEWRDDDGIFQFRSARKGTMGCGHIMLNGQDFLAGFNLNLGSKMSGFYIYIAPESAQKLGYEFDPEYFDNSCVYESFDPIYDDKTRTITSKNEVELFGVKIGKIVLKAYNVEKADFAPYEILSTWKSKAGDFLIYNAERYYKPYMCVSARTSINGNNSKNLTFRWLSDVSEFRIYEEFQEEDYKTITDETPYLAAGSYEYDYDTCKITLNFTKDELLGLQGQTLELSEVS